MKERNYVFAQISKIERINKEHDKRNKERQEELKNKDIEMIIETTKQEIQAEERVNEIEY